MGNHAATERVAVPASGAVERVLRAMSRTTGVCFRVEFVDGSSFRSGDGTPAFTLIFRKRSAESRIGLFGHVGLLEAYFDGGIDLEGDLGAAFRVGMDSKISNRPPRLVWLRNQWHELRFSNRTREQARINARFHYGLGYEFYRRWLDEPYMMYTCAYWKEGTRTLEEAQQNKMEHVCRKIRLAPGERFVDIGCGWGGFMRYAWERYRAVGTGINCTTEQVEEGRAQLERIGLSDNLTIVEADFRDITGEYDKVVSIGVLEHAGRDQLEDVVRAHATCLKPGGLGMLHFIGHVGAYDTEFFIRKHIFPGGWIPGLAETIAAMERAGLEILDIENLRRNYALTLDAWAERFDRRWDEIHALDPARFDERFRRKWRAYLYSCAEMFRSPNGYTHLFQITYSKGNVKDNYPMSRAFLYEPGKPA